MLVKTCKTSVEHKDIVKSVYTGFVYTMETKGVQNNTGPCSNLWKKNISKMFRNDFMLSTKKIKLCKFETPCVNYDRILN